MVTPYLVHDALRLRVREPLLHPHGELEAEEPVVVHIEGEEEEEEHVHGVGPLLPVPEKEIVSL